MLTRLSSLVLCLSVAAAANAQAEIPEFEGFGRYGYTTSPEVAGVRVSPEGVRCVAGGSELLRFPKTLGAWTPQSVSRERFVVAVDGGNGKPSKIRCDSWDSGILLYYEGVIDFGVRSIASPYLSWTEGSVDAGVPTPAADWITISFRDRQAPIVLGFIDSRCGMQITGKPGNYRIRSDRAYRGWLRIGLPNGTQAFPTGDASALGRLVQQTKKWSELWSGPLISRKSTRLRSDGQVIKVDYTFDRKLFCPPLSLHLAKLAGYYANVTSAYAVSDLETGEGPLLVGQGGRLSITFPCRRIPSGRAVVQADGIGPELAKPVWQDPLGVERLALWNLIASRRQVLSDWSRELENSFYETSPMEREPWSRQIGMYKQNGEGLHASAAHALLSLVNASSLGGSKESEKQLTALSYRMDWQTSRFRGVSVIENRRALGAMAVAGALSSHDSDRLIGVWAQVGLSAEEGLRIYRQRRGENLSSGELLLPLQDWRTPIYSLRNPLSLSDPLAEAVFSPMRSLGDIPVWIKSSEGSSETKAKPEVRFFVREKLIGILRFATAFPISLEKGDNLRTFFLTPKTGGMDARYEPLGPGECTAALTLPEWAPSVPKLTSWTQNWDR